MGANQSSTSLSVSKEKLLLERLRALEIKTAADSEYVHVSTEKQPVPTSTLKAPWLSLSVSEVGRWERELLQDSKNRYAMPRMF
jgi:hypothetical protein